MNHKKSRIKNYNNSAKLQNGIDMDIKQGFADTENRYFNADGTGTVILDKYDSPVVINAGEFQDNMGLSLMLNQAVADALAESSDTAVVEINNITYEIRYLGAFGGYSSVEISELGQVSNLPADEFDNILNLNGGAATPLYYGSTYAPSDTQTVILPTDIAGVANLYFNDAMNGDCSADSSPGPIKSFLIALSWSAETGGDAADMATNASQYIQTEMCVATPDVLGCTDSSANNYNSNANLDDGSCTYDPVEPVEPTQPLMTSDTITQFDPIARQPVSDQVAALQESLTRYDKVTAAAKIALKATKDEYDFALEACNDDQNDDRGPCTDAQNLKDYIDTLKVTIDDLNDDVSFIEDIEDAIVAAQSGTAPDPALGLSDGIQMALEAIATNVDTGGEAGVALLGQLNSIYDALDQARADLNVPAGEEEGFHLLDKDIESVSEAEETIDYLVTKYNNALTMMELYGGYVDQYGAMIGELEAELNTIKGQLSTIAGSDPDADTVVQDIIDIQNTIATLTEYQTQIQDLAYGNEPADIEATVSALQEANTMLDEQVTDFENALGVIMGEYGLDAATLDSVTSKLDELILAVSNAEYSLAEYTVTGTPQEFADAVQDAQDLAALLSLGADATAEQMQTAINDLIAENASAQSLINDILNEVSGSDAGNIVSELNTIVTDLGDANTLLEELNTQVAQQAEAIEAQELVNVQLNNINIALGEDLTFYSEQITSIEGAVGDLGETVDDLQDYLTDNYGYADDGSLDSDMPGIND